MNEADPFIDYANLPAPNEGIVVTTFITVRSIARSRTSTATSWKERLSWKRTRAW